MNALSRNTPVAFVVGVAGFLGSSLAGKLLSKGIQVIGVDDLSSGKKDNLEEEIKNKYFHFFNQSATDDLPIELSRLDYVFFVISDDIPASSYRRSLAKVLDLCHKFKTRIVLVSSIDLYDSHKGGLENLKEAEKELAKYALDNKENARIVRMSSVFGPKMHFKGDDPLLRLIRSAVGDELNKESTPLDFTTRSIFIDDACDLLIKAIMHGATAQKIYDGALEAPIKLTEIKQVLLDPLWHESRGFTPTELPPWPTPNLSKTIKELSWHNNTSIVTALKNTIVYFKDHPDLIKVEEEPQLYSRRKVEEKVIDEEGEDKEKVVEERKKIDISLPKKEFWISTRKFSVLILVIILVAYALIYPLIVLGIGVFRIKTHLGSESKAIMTGDFKKVEKEIEGAKQGIGDIKEVLGYLEAVKSIGIFKENIESLDQLVYSFGEVLDASAHAVKGGESLAESFKSVSGENEKSPKEFLDTANLEFDQAGVKLNQSYGKLSDQKFINAFPYPFHAVISQAKNKIATYSKLVEQGKSATFLTSELLPLNDKRKYLVVLEDNTILRPGGGVVNAYAQVSFENGKLVDIKVDQVDALDKKFTEVIAPPAEVKIDSGNKNWYLRDANFDPDFSENGRLMQWFYQKESGTSVAGVISLDLTAVAKLLNIVGAINIGDKRIGSDNIFDVVSDQNSDKNITSLILKELLNRAFFLSKQNWVEMSGSLASSLDQKHLKLYTSDPPLFSYLTSNNLVSVMPRQTKELRGERNEFLSITETDLEGARGSYFLQRNYDLKSKIDAEDKVSHKLIISYLSKGLSVNPLKKRVKFYLPSGTKLVKASWGEKDVLREVSSFSDFGYAGYSLILEFQPGESKNLSLGYEDSKPLGFEEGNIKFNTKVIKQAGMGEDKFNFGLSYPSSLKVVSSPLGKAGNSEVLFSSDLSKDREFVVNLSKVNSSK